MKLHFNTEINDRKELARRLGELTGEPPIYKGGRYAVYQVGGITIGKNGIIEGPMTQQLVYDFSYALRDWEFADADSKNEYTALAQAGKASGDYNIPDDPAPAVEGDNDGGEPDPDVFTVYYPKERFTAESYANLLTLIKMHEALIAKAIGRSPLELEAREEMDTEYNDVLAFHWFPLTEDETEREAYRDLVNCLCETALRIKRVNTKEYPAESERLAMRRFLYRLNMNSEEYRMTRRILMANLSGSAWRNLTWKKKRAARLAVQ